MKVENEFGEYNFPEDKRQSASFRAYSQQEFAAQQLINNRLARARRIRNEKISKSNMTTPEQIIAKIEEIEKMSHEIDLFETYEESADFSYALLRLKKTTVYIFNLPTADPPDESPGQEDMKG